MIDIKGKKVLHKEAKEVLGNAMDYTRARVDLVRKDLRNTDKGLDGLERRLNKVERTLDEYHVQRRAQDVLGAKVSSLDDYKDVTLDDCNDPADLVGSPYIEEIIDDRYKNPFSKNFMEGILEQCDIDGVDGVEICVYRHGKRVRNYNYDKK